MAHILAVDDDPVVRHVIRSTLIDAGHLISMATGGQEALDMITRHRPELVILDIMMPDMSGLDVCKQLRANPYLAKLPIIFLTAKDRPSDIANALDAGGDDFVSKGAISVELPARIRALLRRIPGGNLDPDAEYLATQDFKLHATHPEVQIEDQIIELTPVEHRLLHYLMMRAGQPVPVDRLLKDVWGYPSGVGDPKVVRVTVGRLRSKIEPVAEKPSYLLNIRGRGYMVNSH